MKSPALGRQKQRSTIKAQELPDNNPVLAKDEVCKLLLAHAEIKEALRVPSHADSFTLLRALSHAPNKFETLRNGGLSLAEAMRVADLLDCALQAPQEIQERKKESRSVVTSIFLPCLCIVELVVCGLLVWTLETSTGGWNVGTCSLAMFTNITCKDQTTSRCAVDVEVRGTTGGLRFYTMQGWNLPVAYKTEMGGSNFAAYLGDRLKCCNDENGHVGSCCSLMDQVSEIFCDNLALLGHTAYDGTECPSNNWDCLFLIDEVDPARASAVQPYTPPDLVSFIVAAGVVFIFLLLAVFWSLIVRYCHCTALDRAKARFQEYLKSLQPEDDDEDFELQQRIAAPKLKPSASSLSEGTVVGEQRSFRSGTIISEGDGLVMEKTLTSGSFTSFRGSSEVSDDELPELSPELAHLPEALLSLPGVVEELEMVVEEKRGEARRKAVEEECRKYLRWEAHEKPLNQLGDADIHPNFLNGNLNRYAVMANHALQQKDAALSPLIDPLPPTSSPSVLGDRPGTSRPGTRGSPVSASRPASASRASLSRPASALKPAASRPGSAARPASASAARAASGKPSRQGTVQAWVRPESAKKTAKRPGSARPPRTPLNAPARIEVANF